MVRFFPLHTVLCFSRWISDTSLDRSTITGVILHTSPGRHSSRLCNRTISATTGGRCLIVASTASGLIGLTNSASRAVVLPILSGSTVFSDSWTLALQRLGWRQIDILAEEVIRRSPAWHCTLIGGVLEQECDSLFERAMRSLTQRTKGLMK